MGTRINAIFEHRLSDWNDPELVLKHLAPATNAARRVAEYWLGNGEAEGLGGADQWQVNYAVTPYLYYDGPGGLWVKVGERVASVRTTARWSAFVSNEVIRGLYVAAFRAVAVEFGSVRLAYFPDEDETEATTRDGASLEECFSLLKQRFGKPRMRIDQVGREPLPQAVPAIWFVDDFTPAA